MAAGTLVQGALFTVMVVRAGMLRDPAFAHELAAAGRAQPAIFPERAGRARSEGRRRVRRGGRIRRGARSVARAHAGAGRRAERRAGAACRRRRRRAGELCAERDDQPSRAPGAAPRRPRPLAGRAADRPTRARAAAPRATARLVTEPVRSGTQIYARGGDLDRHRRGQPRRRARGRRQHPRLRPAARPGAGRRRRRHRARESSARGSKPSWSASPGAIWSASNCRRNSRVGRCRSRWSMTG